MITGTISSRVAKEDKVEERHRSLGKYISSQRGHWLSRGTFPEVIFGSNDVSFFKSLGTSAPEGVKMSVCYQIRNERLWNTDDTSSDDYLKVQTSKKVDVALFVSEFLPGLISSFGAYSASFTSKALSDYGFDNSEQNIRAEIQNGRRKVYNVSLVNYWDCELCMRAWGYGLDEVVQRLSGKVESTSIVRNGVLVCVSSKAISLQDEIQINETIQKILLQP